MRGKIHSGCQKKLGRGLTFKGVNKFGGCKLLGVQFWLILVLLINHLTGVLHLRIPIGRKPMWLKPKRAETNGAETNRVETKRAETNRAE